jgi:hypothetical protein
MVASPLTFKFEGKINSVTPLLTGCVLNTFFTLVDKQVPSNIKIVNMGPGVDDCPMVLFEKDNDDDKILLSTETNLWAQYSYQLAHELGHIHCNFREQPSHKYKWFEESLYELSSFQTLLSMANGWRVAAPAPFFASYADSLQH